MIEVVQINAHATWVATPIWAHAGDSLEFSAEGTWVDGYIPCTADGYGAALFYALRLYPRVMDDGRYFRLMGRIAPDGIEPTRDDPASTFPIGTKSHRTVERAGRLFVFANDRAGFYWNNWGKVSLTISKRAVPRD